MTTPTSDTLRVRIAEAQGWTCSCCGIVTDDISPLGPEGVVICEECAAPPRYHWTVKPFVEQFR